MENTRVTSEYCRIIQMHVCINHSMYRFKQYLRENICRGICTEAEDILHLQREVCGWFFERCKSRLGFFLFQSLKKIYIINRHQCLSTTNCDSDIAVSVTN